MTQQINISSRYLREQLARFYPPHKRRWEWRGLGIKHKTSRQALLPKMIGSTNRNPPLTDRPLFGRVSCHIQVREAWLTWHRMLPCEYSNTVFVLDYDVWLSKEAILNKKVISVQLFSVQLVVKVDQAVFFSFLGGQPCSPFN